MTRQGRHAAQLLAGVFSVIVTISGTAMAQTSGSPSTKPQTPGSSSTKAAPDADKAKSPAKDASKDSTKASTEVDNTRINARDKSASSMTPEKQSNRARDREIAANVRKAVVADKSLSTNAHNIKVMTINGSVTLRGPVANNAEKQRVGTLAKEVAGVTDVINNVDVPPPKPPKKKH